MLSDANRERLIAALREYYAAGQLTLAELDRRVGVVLAAADAAEAAAAVADLPPLGVPGGVNAPGAPVSGRRRGRRRHAEAVTPEPGWVPTAERFRDPSSGTVMRVWTDPVDGARHYVPDDSAP